MPIRARSLSDAREARFEKTDVSPRIVFYALLGFFAAIAASAGFVALVLWAMSATVTRGAARRRPPRASSPPAPRLETLLGGDRAAIEARAKARLAGYAAVEKGRARIPIERAMELLAAHGWPEPDEAPSQAGRPDPRARWRREGDEAAALLALAIASCIGGAAAKPFDPFAAATIEQKRGAQIPLDLAFRDEQDRTVTLRAIGGGKPIVLAPVLHHCPNICGVTLGGLADAVAGQAYRAGRDFTVVAFGIDPQRDSRGRTQRSRTSSSEPPDKRSQAGCTR